MLLVASQFAWNVGQRSVFGQTPVLLHWVPQDDSLLVLPPRTSMSLSSVSWRIVSRLSLSDLIASPFNEA